MLHKRTQPTLGIAEASLRLGEGSQGPWNYINEPKPTLGIAEASPEAWRRISRATELHKRTQTLSVNAQVFLADVAKSAETNPFEEMRGAPPPLDEAALSRSGRGAKESESSSSRVSIHIGNDQTKPNSSRKY